MTLTLDDLKSPEFRGDKSYLPTAQLLNDKAKPVLFIKEDNLKLAGWTGGDKDGEKYTHTYNNGKAFPGLAFASCRMHVLLTSPRFVELTENGAAAFPDLGKKNDILASFETPEGQNLRESMQNQVKGSTTLRTFYLIYLVNAKNENLHKVPFTLSVHGAAAAQFGKALEQHYRLVEIAFSSRNPEDGYMTLDNRARSLTIFQPTFGVEMVGDTKKSAVCTVKSFAEPKPETVESFFCLNKHESFWATQASLAGFARRYMSQMSETIGVHQIAAGVDTDAIEVSAQPVVGKADFTLDD